MRRHLTTVYSKPIQPHNRRAFEWLRARVGSAPRWVLDAGCGTGISTRGLAVRHPDAWTVGVDKSAHRLARGVGLQREEGGRIENRTVWLRADLIDLLRLAADERWRIEHLYILYPNPWPKPGQLRRRWHGHPVFPTLLHVARRITLRTNWSAYAVEFAEALATAGVEHALRGAQGEDISPFEAKYRASGHSLYEVVTRVGFRSDN